MDTMEMVRPVGSDELTVGSQRAVGRLRRRVPAFVVDWSLVLVAGVVAAMPGGVLAGGSPVGSVLYAAGYAMSLLGFLAAVPGYWLGCWRWLDGRSAGQRLLGLRVLRSSGGRLSAGRMLGRELGLKWGVHAVSFGLWLPVGALVALSDPTRRALHDRVVDTVVVREPKAGAGLADVVGLAPGTNGTSR